MRSFEDRSLGVKIDNGNHLCLQANNSLLGIIKDIDIEGNFDFFEPEINFIDAKNSDRYSYKALANIANKLNLKDKLKLLKFLVISPSSKTVDEEFKSNEALYYYLINPLCRSILNTPPKKAEPYILKNVFNKILRAGKQGFRYFYPSTNWGDAFISPLKQELISRGVKITTESALSECKILDNKINQLIFKDKKVANLGVDDVVVFATPAPLTANFIDITYPDQFQPITNIHFKYKPKFKGIIGVVGSDYVEWIFAKKDHISITVSAAEHLNGLSNEKIAQGSWQICAKYLGEDAQKLPEYRVICEKRASFECSSKNLNNRPKNTTKYKNCYITGDYVQNYLPSTIEGSIINSKKLADILRP